MTVGLLGLQGAFQDHIPHLQRCGAAWRMVRSPDDLRAIQRLIIPGGESTVMSKFLRQFGMAEPLQELIGGGLPVWGVCAGSIILADLVDGCPGTLCALPIHASRNAYGRQIASSLKFLKIRLFDVEDYPAVFIRAPRIESIGSENVLVHAFSGSDPVFVQKERIMATTFHPELNRQDDTFHRYFLKL